jgi:hypothetical protein
MMNESCPAAEALYNTVVRRHLISELKICFSTKQFIIVVQVVKVLWIYIHV